MPGKIPPLPPKGVAVSLAYPYQGHAPGDVIEVTKAEATRLIYNGRARAHVGPLPEPIPAPSHEPKADESAETTEVRS